jgi:hypothetical protein
MKLAKDSQAVPIAVHCAWDFDKFSTEITYEAYCNSVKSDSLLTVPSCKASLAG